MLLSSRPMFVISIKTKLLARDLSLFISSSDMFFAIMRCAIVVHEMFAEVYIYNNTEI